MNMKRIFQILSVLLIITIGTHTPAQGKKTSESNIRFCTYNIQGDLPNDGINSWKFRKDSLCKIIRQHNFDIVCMQEVLANQLEDIEKATGYAFVGIRGLYNPIFYKADRFELLHNEMFWLSDSMEPFSKGWDGKYDRYCTWAKFRDTEDCRTFFVFNTHLDHVGETAKLEGARLICRKVKEMAAEEAVFITGDMNSTPETAPIAAFNKEFSNSRDIAREKSGPAGTAHSYGKLYPPSQIDYIFVNEPVSVTKAVTITKMSDPVYMSDHYPIVITAYF